MIVDTHAFKIAFVAGETSGFVVCAERPATPGRAALRIFAEIYGAPNRYHIFETRPAAEFQMALAATGDPPVDGLSVHEVRVENIRDYQTLCGFKTVFLVDRDRRATESLRVGDPPFSVRTRSPFSPSRPEGLRVATSTPTAKPFAPRAKTTPPIPLPTTDGDPAASPAATADSRPRRAPGALGSATSDPFANVPFDDGRDSRVNHRATSPRPGLITRLVRALLGKR